MSKLYLGLKDYPLVEKIIKKALESEPENVELLSVLAQNYYHRGWWLESIELFSRLIELRQTSSFVHNSLGQSHYQKRNYKEAIEQYEILLEGDEEDWGTHLVLAKLYNFKNDQEKALDHAKKALYFKDLPLDDIYETTGEIYRTNRQFTEAMKAFQKAVKENPNNPKTYYRIAIVADNYYEDKKAVLEKYEKALEKYKELKSNPYFEQVIQERMDILKREIFMNEKKK